MSLGTLEGTGLGHIPILVFTRATDSGPSPPSINGLVKPCHTREQRFPPFTRRFPSPITAQQAMSSLVTKDCAIISPLQFSADVIWPGKKAEVLSKAGHTWRVIRRYQ